MGGAFAIYLQAKHSFLTVQVLIALLLLPAFAWSATVAGGGSKKTDCMVVLDAPGANHPAPPKTPRGAKCYDGDLSCDADGLRNGRCEFELSVCLNSSALSQCSPVQVDEVEIDHAIDDGDPRFDVDFQALQSRVDLLAFPGNDIVDECTLTSSINVPLRGPNSSDRMRAGRKKLKLSAEGSTAAGTRRDRDRVKFKCLPEGDKIYEPLDLYDGTFDRIATQVFAASCAVSACHDSESNAGGLTLLPNAAYSQLVGVAPTNTAAAIAGLLRVTAGDPDASFLYLKVTHDLAAGYGIGMPLGKGMIDGELQEIIRLWVLGDGVLGPAPQAGWVEGTW